MNARFTATFAGSTPNISAARRQIDRANHRWCSGESARTIFQCPGLTFTSREPHGRCEKSSQVYDEKKIFTFTKRSIAPLHSITRDTEGGFFPPTRASGRATERPTTNSRLEKLSKARPVFLEPRAITRPATRSRGPRCRIRPDDLWWIDLLAGVPR